MDPVHGSSGSAFAAIPAGLAIAGLIPSAGALFDSADALMALARGDATSASHDAPQPVPGTSAGATAGKRATQYGDEAAAVEVVAARSILCAPDTIGWTPIATVVACWRRIAQFWYTIPEYVRSEITDGDHH